MADFFEASGDGSTWDKISRNGLERIRSRCAPLMAPCALMFSALYLFICTIFVVINLDSVSHVEIMRVCSQCARCRAAYLVQHTVHKDILSMLAALRAHQASFRLQDLVTTDAEQEHTRAGGLASCFPAKLG